MAAEYDKSTMNGVPEAETYKHESISSPPGRGTSRVKGPDVDVSVLKEPITLPFSGRTAKNRFLKAPMTERLCHWNKEGEDIVCLNFNPLHS
jgi:hypothetical protein